MSKGGRKGGREEGREGGREGGRERERAPICLVSLNANLLCRRRWDSTFL